MQAQRRNLPKRFEELIYHYRERGSMWCLNYI